MRISSIFICCLLLTAVFLSVFSCSKIGLNTIETIPATLFTPQHVSISEVVSYVNKSKGVLETKSSLVRISPISNQRDTVMYLVNYEEGWELLSAFRGASRVLMKSDKGNFSVNDIDGNPTAQEFISLLSGSLSRALHDNSYRAPDYFSDTWENDRSFPGGGGPGVLDSLYTAVLDTTIWINLQSRSVGPLLSTHWGQKAPWNISMPYKDAAKTEHCYCGCVPVAAGQVLYYLKDKFSLSAYTYQFADCNLYLQNVADSIVLSPSDVSFSWPSLNNWYYMARDTTYAEGYDEVSSLLISLGIDYQAKYKQSGTSASLYSTINVFPGYSVNCQYTNIRNDYSPFIAACESEIYEEDLPLLMSIAFPNPNNPNIEQGHAVVIDGYKFSQDQKVYYYSYYDENNNLMGSSVRFGEVEDSRFVTINWGWSGKFDSTPSNIIWTNIFTDWIIGNYNFSLKRYIIHDFQS